MDGDICERWKWKMSESPAFVHTSSSRTGSSDPGPADGRHAGDVEVDCRRRVARLEGRGEEGLPRVRGHHLLFRCPSRCPFLTTIVVQSRVSNFFSRRGFVKAGWN